MVFEHSESFLQFLSFCIHIFICGSYYLFLVSFFVFFIIIVFTVVTWILDVAVSSALIQFSDSWWCHLSFVLSIRLNWCRIWLTRLKSLPLNLWSFDILIAVQLIIKHCGFRFCLFYPTETEISTEQMKGMAFPFEFELRCLCEHLHAPASSFFFHYQIKFCSH